MIQMEHFQVSTAYYCGTVHLLDPIIIPQVFHLIMSPFRALLACIKLIMFGFGLPITRPDEEEKKRTALSIPTITLHTHLTLR
jgi:hypothetical protein